LATQEQKKRSSLRSYDNRIEECETTLLGHKGPRGNEGSKNSITLSDWVVYSGSTLISVVPAEADPGILILLPDSSFSFTCTEIPIIGETTIRVTGEGIAGVLEAGKNRLH
jgi:hypothetical protein